MRLPISFELPPVSLGVGGGNYDAASGKISMELVRIFKEASRNFKITFQDIEDTKKSKNHRRIYRKY
jgi:hypothetical protein